jgi:hypothetical protein
VHGIESTRLKNEGLANIEVGEIEQNGLPAAVRQPRRYVLAFDALRTRKR